MTPNAWDYLDRQENPSDIIDEMVEEKKDLPFPLGRDVLRSFVEKGKDDDESSSTQDLEVSIEILSDITGESTCTGQLDDFVDYFSSRYEKLRAVISKRRESQGAMDINTIKKRKGEGKVIAMVGDIYSTSNGNKVLKLEDPTGHIKGFISQDSEAYDADLLGDEVVLAEGSVWEGDGDYDVTFNIDKIVRPGVPKISQKKKKDFEGKMAFLGDLHVGSEAFIDDAWEHFIDWIKNDEGAQSIRYLIISGDLVDGIGIYPNQEDELTIKNIYEQYEEMARMLSEIPEDIQIIAIPGNHDIVRNPEPQPSLPEEIQDMFSDNVRFVGNPSFLDIEGVKLLLYHGNSINDLSDLIYEVSSDNPVRAMKEMMKRRHLVPVYGKKTPIAPEEEDHLVIDEVPDIFVTGHVHHTEIEKYHDTILINSSTWQDQTDYQKMRDIQPDPGKLVVLNPSSRKVTIQSFV